MDTHLLARLKEICIEEASYFEVPPALIDVIIVKLLFKTSKRYMITQYLANGALYRLLKNRNGPFTVILYKEQPTIRYVDGTIIGSDQGNPPKWVCRWDALIYKCIYCIIPGFREQITRTLYERISTLLTPCYAIG